MTKVGVILATLVLLASCDGAPLQHTHESPFISRQEALQRASQEEGEGLETTSIDARLDWYRADKNDDQQRVWIVTYNDVQVPVEGPAPEDDHQAPPQCFTNWEIVLDARTGAFVVAGSSDSARCDN